MLTRLVQHVILWSVRRRARTGLDGIHVTHLERARRLVAEGPVIFAANHVSWWDGFVMALLNKQLDIDYVVLMEAQQLRVFSFFQAFGAVGVDRDRPEGGQEAIAKILQGISTGRSAWIFPQGRQRPWSMRPLGLRSGVAVLASQAAVPVVPVSIAYPFLKSGQPTALIDFGEAIPGRSDTLLEQLETALSETLDRHTQQADAGELGDYELISPRVYERPGLGTTILRGIWNRFGKGVTSG